MPRSHKPRRRYVPKRHGIETREPLSGLRDRRAADDLALQSALRERRRSDYGNKSREDEQAHGRSYSIKRQTAQKPFNPPYSDASFPRGKDALLLRLSM